MFVFCGYGNLVGLFVVFFKFECGKDVGVDFLFYMCDGDWCVVDVVEFLVYV